MEKSITLNKPLKPKLSKILKDDFRRNKVKYAMISVIVLYYILFYYVPMYGTIIAFQDFVPRKGIMGSNWVGFKHFINFFNDLSFWKVLKNTLTLSFLDLCICFPSAILFALFLNEIRCRTFKKTVQTITYLPHFISLVVICGMIKEFCGYNGLFNYIGSFFGAERVSMLQQPNMFKWIFIFSKIWQELGWSSIIYLAAFSGINEELYEAAEIDGAGRIRQTLVVTLPGILPTVVIMLVLRIGQILGIGHEKVLLLYNPATYEKADVIMSFVFRKGLEEFNWSYSTAVNMFNSIANFTFLILANTASKKLTESSLW
ncbi:MAG: sugar ABC transporter permease [Clostridia bacterium]|nr:sugar ABC transporter permease [Clostridia bacterium]